MPVKFFHTSSNVFIFAPKDRSEAQHELNTLCIMYTWWNRWRLQCM